MSQGPLLHSSCELRRPSTLLGARGTRQGGEHKERERLGRGQRGFSEPEVQPLLLLVSLGGSPLGEEAGRSGGLSRSCTTHLCMCRDGMWRDTVLPSTQPFLDKAEPSQE